MTPADLPDVNEQFAKALADRDYTRAEQLLKRGAQIDRELRREQTFDRDVVEETSSYLIDASAAGDVDAVKFLLRRGADPNIAADFTGRTALLSAVEWSHPDVVDLLLAHSVDVEAIDRYQSLTPMEYATTNVEPRIVRSLLAAGARGSFRRLNFSIDGGARAREVVRLLADHGVDINEIDDWGYTPLMWAAQYAEAETVRFMIELGADVNRVSEPNMNGVDTNETALRLARKQRRADIIAVLLKHGAHDVARPGSGESLLTRIWDTLTG